ncbi:MFS transporter [Pleionea sediminis]|uniref:MFS transporter n=1 Tax=Pleionea sediminis TaxID=2569479 RepID=UPI001186E5BB|nr:MFS transporter [Pleionea sediminis]
MTTIQQPFQLLKLMAIAMPLAFASWMTLLNNFTVEVAQFTGKEIGLLQSIREVPGFLAFTAVFILALLHEQRFALLSLLLLAAGVLATPFFPSTAGLLTTTFIMSVGFHYFETLNQSLKWQWLSKEHAAQQMGKLVAIGSVSSLGVYSFIWLANHVFELTYLQIYLVTAGASLLLVLYMMLRFPLFKAPVEQHKKIILRKKYWLYYALTFMSGARRQIFVVFAGFMMVEKFGYDVGDIALLYLVNHLFNFFFAEKIGRWIGRVGERRALLLEYIGLACVFTSYAFVSDKYIAAGLYVIDHLFFAMAIAIKTYFQKIAEPGDMASTSAVSFTINHIAAVVIPVIFGLIWLQSPSLVFLIGSGMALTSLLLSRFVPYNPTQENRIDFYLMKKSMTKEAT